MSRRIRRLSTSLTSGAWRLDTRTALSRYNLRRAYRDAITRISDPTVTLPPTVKRVLSALRRVDQAQTVDQLADHGRRLHPSTVEAALACLEVTELAAPISDDGLP